MECTLEQIFFILFLLFIGYICKFLSFPSNFSQSLNFFVIYISVPATILLQIPKITFDTSLLLPIITPWIVLALSVFLVLFVFKNESANTKAALLLLIPLGNTSFFGFPMLEAILGSEALKYAILYDQFGTFLILATYGSFVLAYYEGKKLTLKSITKKIAIFPPFIFLIFAFVVGEMPQSSIKYLQILSSTLVPLALISVGFSMQLRLENEKIVFAKALVLKLLLIPFIILVSFRVFGFSDLVASATLLESAMPPMITAGALAISAGFAPRLSAALVGYGLVFSIFSIIAFNYINKVFL